MTDRPRTAMVLVVQADEVGAPLASGALRRAGYAPRVTGSASEAVRLLARKTFAAVVLAETLQEGSPWTVLGVARAHPVPTPVIMVTDPDDERSAEEALLRGAADVLRRSGDYWARLPGTVDRAVRLARGMAAGTAGTAGTVGAAGAARSFGVAREIADRRRREEIRRHTRELEHAKRQAVEASRLHSELVASVAHELRTPLTAILGFAELLHDGKAGSLNPRQRRYLEHILGSARHVIELVNGLLDLAKLEAGRIELRPQRLSPAGVAAEVIGALHAQAAAKGIHVGLETSSEIDQVVGDPAKLKQVLFNYLSNALKHTPPAGTVTVRLLPQGPQDYRLEVEDTGDGIRPDQLAQLFTDFHQLAASAGEMPLGTGLGLAVTKRLVEAQGGSVGARSAPGVGSLFFAVLPRRLSRRIAYVASHPPAAAS